MVVPQHDGTSRSFPACHTCGTHHGGDDGFSSPEEAIAAWNTRADDPQWIELPEGWEDQDGIYTEFLRKRRIRGDLEALFFSPSCPQDIRVSSCLAFNGPWKKSKATHIAKWTPPKGPDE